MFGGQQKVDKPGALVNIAAKSDSLNRALQLIRPSAFASPTVLL